MSKVVLHTIFRVVSIQKKEDQPEAPGHRSLRYRVFSEKVAVKKSEENVLVPSKAGLIHDTQTFPKNQS